VKRVLAAATLVCAALAATATRAEATTECRGLPVCVRITGPWVVVPSGGGVARRRVEFQLACPRRYVIGGVDAELSDRAIDISFLGKLGGPIAPGITTSRKAVFVATFVGASRRSVTFRPHLGCVPSNGSGGAIPTAAIVRPGLPAVRRVHTLKISPGRTRSVAAGCASAERLVAGSHAVGFFTARPPTAQLVAAVAARQRFVRGRVAVAAKGSLALGRVRAIVQVSAICAGGK
jgi:hypothetical protein